VTTFAVEPARTFVFMPLSLSEWCGMHLDLVLNCFNFVQGPCFTNLHWWACQINVCECGQ